MNNEEAIETIKIAIADVEWNYPLNYTVAFEVAISALEKQIPKRPIEDTANLTDFKTFHCPTCNKKIVLRLDGEWIAGRPQKYCENCGQKLNWEGKIWIKNSPKKIWLK